jgi:hypothetical protein
MAKILPIHGTPRVTKPEVSIYPWDEYFDGRLWKLTRGEDFVVTANNFAQYARLRAYRRGLKQFHVAVRGNDVYIQNQTGLKEAKRA